MQEILNAVQVAFCKTNPDYDLVIETSPIYDMKLAMFGIDRNRNLIFSFQYSFSHIPNTTDIASNRNGASSHHRSE